MPTSLNAQLNVKLNAASLNASTKQVKQALGRITGQASEFQKSLDASTARVFAFGATTAVLNGVSQAFRKLVATTVEVQKRLIEINSIFKATETAFNRFRNAIFRVAAETGQSFATVAEGAAELARQGLSAAETANRLKAALVLTRISGMDAEKSVKALTAAINGFTSASLTANQIVNKMVAVDTAFAVSTQDLAEAFSRAGSTAEDAGVSFNELLGLITAVEQRTARGGAVIGNAFKSIFTRLSRGSTIEELKALGVEINATQSGIQKLQALSKALEGISDPTVASKIKELAGGVFQINVVSAALKDLGSDTSVFKNAALVAASAMNEAFEKNAGLNESISAQMNALVQGLTSLAERIGSITFGPLLEGLLGIANKFTTFLDKALDPEKGNTFIKGFFKAIGSFLGGPAVILFTAAVVKITKLIAKFAIEGLRSLFQIGTQTEKIKQIEGGIVGLLGNDAALRKVIVSTTSTQAQKEQAIITAIQTENSLLTQQAALVRGLASAAAARGVTGFGASGFKGRRGRNFAGGFQQEEAMATMLGAKNPKAQRSEGTIGGRHFTKNTEELEIKNFGRNGDSAVIPMTYAGGFIPNYAVGRGVLDIQNAQRNKFIGANGEFRSKWMKDAAADPKSKAGAALLAQKNKNQTKEVIVVNPAKTAMLIPTIGMTSKIEPLASGKFQQGKKRYNYEYKSGLQVYGPKVPKAVDQAADPEDERLKKSITKGVTTSAANFAKLLHPVLGEPKPNQIRTMLEKQGGGKGALRGLIGAAFEAAVNVALGISPAEKVEGGDFDVKSKAMGGNMSKTGLKRVIKLFGIKSKQTALMDFKVNALKGSEASFAKKLFNQNRYKPEQRPMKGKARGFIPNFAGGLTAAIGREKAAGIPVSNIRAHFDKGGRPKAVTNTRDEPNGLASLGFIPNFAKGEGGGGGMGGLMMGLFALQGVLATFAAKQEQNITTVVAETEKRNKAIDVLKLGFKAAQKERKINDSLLKKKKEEEPAITKFVSSLDTAAKALMAFATVNMLTGGGMGRVGGKIIGLGKGAKAARLRDAAVHSKKLQSRFGGKLGAGGVKASKEMAKRGMKRAAVKSVAGRAGMAGMVAYGAYDLGRTYFDKDLNKEEKKQRMGKTGSGLAMGATGAMAGAAIGSVVPVIGTAIGGLIGGIAGYIAGEWGGGKIFGTDATAKKEERKVKARGMVEKEGSLGFDEHTFAEMVDKNLAKIDAAGGDAGAVAQRYRDAMTDRTELLAKEMEGGEVTAEALIAAGDEVIAASMALAGSRFDNAEDFNRNANEQFVADQNLIRETDKLAFARQEQVKFMKKTNENLARAKKEQETGELQVGLKSAISGPYAGAVGLASEQNLMRQKINTALAEKTKADRELAFGESGGVRGDDLIKLQDAASKAGALFRAQTFKAGTSFLNTIKKTEDLITANKKKQEELKLKAFRTTQEVVEGLMSGKKGGDIASVGKFVKDFGTRLETIKRNMDRQGRTEFNKEEQTKLNEFMREYRERAKNEGIYNPEAFLKTINPLIYKLFEGLTSAQRTSPLRDYGPTGPNASREQRAEAAAYQAAMKKDDKEKGTTEEEALKGLVAAQRDLATQLAATNANYKQLMFDPATKGITGELQKLKEGMDAAASSYQGVKSFVKDMNLQTVKTAALITENAEFVLTQTKVIKDLILVVKSVQQRVDRLKNEESE